MIPSLHAIFAADKTRVQAGSSNGLLTSLLAYYKMDAASGNEPDATSNGKTLTANNNPSSTAGIINNCRGNNGVSNNVFTRTDSSFSPGAGAFSVSFWTKLNSIQNSFPAFLGKYDTGNNNREWCVLLDNSGKPYLEVSVNGSSVAASVVWTSSLSILNWYHIVVVINGSQIRIAVNGGNFISTNFSSTIFNGSAAFAVLCRLINGSPAAGLDGNIDECGVWTKELAQTDVLNLYNGGAGLAYSLFT